MERTNNSYNVIYYVKQFVASFFYYLHIAMPFVVAALGVVIIGLSADIVDFSHRAMYQRYSIQTEFWNQTSQHWEPIKVDNVLGKPSRYEFKSFKALLAAGIICTILGTIVGSLVLKHRYSLLRLRLGDTQKYRWIFPTCVALDTTALITTFIVAIYAATKEGIQSRYYTLFQPENLIDLAPGIDYDIWMYMTRGTFGPTRWTCSFQHWTRGFERWRFEQYCNESQATVWIMIALAILTFITLCLHIWAWISTKNKSPLFLSAEEASHPNESD